MLFIVSVNSLLSLKKAFFKYLIRTLKDYPIHVHAMSKPLRINFVLNFVIFKKN